MKKWIQLDDTSWLKAEDKYLYLLGYEKRERKYAVSKKIIDPLALQLSSSEPSEIIEEIQTGYLESYKQLLDNTSSIINEFINEEMFYCFDDFYKFLVHNLFNDTVIH